MQGGGVASYNQGAAFVGETEQYSEYEATETVVCCNLKLISALKNPKVQESLDLLSDEYVISGLLKVKEMGEQEGAINLNNAQQLTSQQQVVTTSKQNPTTQAPQPTLLKQTEIKEEVIDSTNTQSQPQPQAEQTMSAEDFDNISRSPKGKGGQGRKRATGDEASRTPKKPKVSPPPDLSYVDKQKSLAQLKRQAIRDCNEALKIVRPNNDPERYIYNTCRSHGRALYFGPPQPHSFYKIIALFFPEMGPLTDPEKVSQLMSKLSRFILKNMDWTEVNKKN